MSENTRRVDVSEHPYHPRYVVWELTLRCDQFCTHCGSRAGDARDTELTTSEALDVVAQLADMGTKDVVLIGGEAYLHPGFLEIVRALRDAGITPGMTTGGMSVTPALARDMAEAGLRQASVSVDGLAVAHDLIRGKKGSFTGAINALDAMRDAGIAVAANTNVNRVNRDDLEALFALLSEKGIQSWQVQITVPLGRAADRANMVLQPYDLLHLMPRLAAIKRQAFQRGITMMSGNNLGYFGPEEALLRSMFEGGTDHWKGCMAGKFVMGIESDGAVKGCPSLQTDSYVGGHLKSRKLRDIWENTPELSFARRRTVEDLWGYCRECVFAETCMGGCSFTSHALFGRPGNNPYCHYRVRTLAKQGQRERLVPETAAAGLPFDNGTFAIVVEDLDATEPHVIQEPRDEAVPDDPQAQKKRLARLVKKFVYQQAQSPLE